MNRPAPLTAQRGVVLWLLLIIVAMAGGYAFYRNANTQFTRSGQDTKLAVVLAQAKEAVIAYAVMDATRPGRLLCPDLLGDGISPLLAGPECADYVGGLPWKTLDVRDFQDDHGTRLQFAVHSLFGGRDRPINSDTATTMRVIAADGSINDDVVGVIIAPRGALDPVNSDGDDTFQVGKLATDGDNDLIAVITRQELMAAVEKRVANELRACLEQHAAQNPLHTYPWPASLANIVRTEITYTDGTKGSIVSNKGNPKSLFGMVPDTQAGNPEEALKDSINQLKITKNSLNTASTIASQQNLAKQLQDQVAYALALFNQLYLAAIELDSRARVALSAFSTLDATIAAATRTKATYTAQSSTLPTAIETAQPSLQAFSSALANTGIDLFYRELELRNQDLLVRISAVATNPSSANFSALLTTINNFKNRLLDYSWTPNADIENAISAAYTASIDAATAVNTARKTLNSETASQAQLAAMLLFAANQQIESAILTNRINVSGGEVDALSARITSTLAGYTGNTGLPNLVASLESARTLVSGLKTGSSSLNASRSTTLATLNAAISATQTGNDENQIRTNSANSVEQLGTLASALNNNGDNVALETLKSVAATFETAKQGIPAKVTDGRALRAPAQTVVYWSGIATNHAPDLAREARRGIVSGNIAVADNENSAYSTAAKLLDGLTGENGTLTLLDKAANNANAEALVQANAALNKTRALLDTLISAAENIDAMLPTSMAQGTVPTVWYSPTCSFLLPNTSTGSWWTANGWKALAFYQLSGATNTSTATLTVNNGADKYRVVTLMAGRALSGQSRATLSTANFLEGTNADPSRDGDAMAPTPGFTAQPPSATFNDRLSY
ncbi:MAG: hypothetical protein E6R09_14080 [Rhodocyclaceae bacterium]|nr:MAG: hypothetical protein E6R09_14080 [Rhodocyclaceae bacterium]